MVMVQTGTDDVTGEDGQGGREGGILYEAMRRYEPVLDGETT